MSSNDQLITTALITMINLELKMAYATLDTPEDFVNPQKMLYQNIQNAIAATKKLQDILDNHFSSA